VILAHALATTLAAAAPAAGHSVAYDVAAAIARRGPRVAGSPLELAAHRTVAGRFRRGRLRVSSFGFRVPGRGHSRDVIGAWNGRRHCLKIFMAHADSMPGAPGADDNASGLGALADLAGRLAALRPPCDVWLVATGAEERLFTGQRDHLGALGLARRVRRRGLAPRLRWALSLDEVGRGHEFWLRSPAARARPPVEGALLSAGRRTGVRVTWVRDADTGNSDHREFELLGLPGMKLGVIDDPCRHHPCDRPSRLQDPALRAAVRVAVALARAG
jgi:aminopeptidase YwaD